MALTTAAAAALVAAGMDMLLPHVMCWSRSCSSSGSKPSVVLALLLQRLPQKLLLFSLLLLFGCDWQDGGKMFTLHVLHVMQQSCRAVCNAGCVTGVGCTLCAVHLVCCAPCVCMYTVTLHARFAAWSHNTRKASATA